MSTKKIRLNRFLARAGLCSRRQADRYIQAGDVMVNGKVVTDFSLRISPTKDQVLFRGKPVTWQEEHAYYVLNKPPGVITATKDPYGRPTVLDLLEGVPREGLFPVGRLDKDTTGVLLLTTDGELAEKLTHPRYQVPKVYRAHLDREIWPEDLEKLKQGIRLEDGWIQVDSIRYVHRRKNPKKIELTIHSGRKRIVRRMFEALGYQVVYLDRISFAGITKKKLSQGEWRALTEEEVEKLKRFSLIH